MHFDLGDWRECSPDELGRRLVRLLRPYEVAAQSAIYLVYLPNRTLPTRVRALIDYLVERFGSIPSWEVDL
jgi:DNA-binding transcriptional LysR family regulator